MSSRNEQLVDKRRSRNIRKAQEKYVVALTEEQEARRQKIVTWFAQYDHDLNDVLDREEMRRLLTAIKRTEVGPDAPEVEDADIARVFATHGSRYSPVPGVERDQVLPAVQAYVAYISSEILNKSLFDKYDADRGGSLSADELLPLLREVAPPPHRPAEEADSMYILKMCDKDGSGQVSIDELRPAIATWLELSKVVEPEEPVPEKRPKSSACVVL